MNETIMFMVGVGFGMVVSMVLMTASIIMGTIENDKRIKKEVREAHDKGYSNGRKWHDREIEWAEIEIECIKNALRKVGRNENKIR